MNKDKFWELIEQSKKDCKQDIDKMVDAMKNRLRELPTEEVAKFFAIQHEYKENAYKSGLWDAGTIMNKGICTDDGFIDFRAWLISQGKDTYMNALKNPDSLAELKVLPSKDGYYMGESLDNVAYDIYKEQTGFNIYAVYEKYLSEEEKAEIKGEIEYEPTIDKAREWEDAEKYLPRLSAKYMSSANIESHSSCLDETSDFYIKEVESMPDEDKLEWFCEFVETATERSFIPAIIDGKLTIQNNSLAKLVDLSLKETELPDGDINLKIKCDIKDFSASNLTEICMIASDLELAENLFKKLPPEGITVSKEAYQEYISDNSQQFGQIMQ